MRYDYVVIGAGISGIACALILAKNGIKVALVEKSNFLAPLIHGFKRKGVFFDTGFHYTGSLDAGESLEVFFHYLGISDKIEKIEYTKDGFDIFRSVNSEFEFKFPYSYERIKEKFYEAFPKDKLAINNYLSLVKETYHSFPYINLDAEMDPVKLVGSLYDISLNDFLDRLTDNKLLKYLLSLHCLLHGSPPSDIPFANHACVVGAYYESVNGIYGGGLSLIKAFEVELKNNGVELYLGHNVTEIVLSSDGVSGVKIENGDYINSTGCISTIHPHLFLRIINKSFFRPAYIKRLNALEESCSAYLLFAVCNSSVYELEKNNLYLFSTKNREALLKSDIIEESPLYISSARNRKNGEFGFVAISPTTGKDVLKWADTKTGKRPDDYISFKENIQRKLLEHIEKYCSYLKNKIIYSECATPLTLRDFSNSPFGSMYGVKYKVGQYNPMTLTRVKGLFLSGQATSAPGILGAVVSAFLTCGTILGHDFLRGELKKCL
ncbi:MAG: NAD(P)/FAD-dependent oxidoreductase [Desulfobacterales bacterium]|nr:NAD(P)/FAD-dependent oxidoreductase [Desulfobacterales bacterium]